MNMEINPSEYTLFVDCTLMNIFTQNYVEGLGATFKIYAQTGFKNVIMKLATSSVVKMQLNRMARNANVNFEIIE